MKPAPRSLSRRCIGRGYRFIAPVTTAAPKAEQSAAATPNVEKSLSSNMVGREQEWAKLQAWYSQVLDGYRHVIFVSGEAGIGKTTFVQAFVNTLAHCGGGVRVGRGQCIEQYGSGEAYMPVLEALSRFALEARRRAGN